MGRERRVSAESTSSRGSAFKEMASPCSELRLLSCPPPTQGPLHDDATRGRVHAQEICVPNRHCPGWDHTIHAVCHHRLISLVPLSLRSTSQRSPWLVTAAGCITIGTKHRLLVRCLCAWRLVIQERTPGHGRREHHGADRPNNEKAGSAGHRKAQRPLLPSFQGQAERVSVVREYLAVERVDRLRIWDNVKAPCMTSWICV